MKTPAQSIARSTLGLMPSRRATQFLGCSAVGRVPTHGGARTFLTSVLILAGTLLILASNVRADNDPDQIPPSQISGASVFYQQLLWVGETPPTDTEDRALWEILQKMLKSGVAGQVPELEQFIADHPRSPWLPSLQANLGRFSYEHGRYTAALKYWEDAWAATHTATNGPAKRVGDFTFAYWTRLLASLGRLDTLRLCK